MQKRDLNSSGRRILHDFSISAVASRGTLLCSMYAVPGYQTKGLDF